MKTAYQDAENLDEWIDAKCSKCGGPLIPDGAGREEAESGDQVVYWQGKEEYIDSNGQETGECKDCHCCSYCGEYFDQLEPVNNEPFQYCPKCIKREVDHANGFEQR